MKVQAERKEMTTVVAGCLFMEEKLVGVPGTGEVKVWRGERKGSCHARRARPSGVELTPCSDAVRQACQLAGDHRRGCECMREREREREFDKQ